MKTSSLNSLCQTIGLAAIAGMRAALAPAFLAYQFSKKPFDDLKDSPFNAVQRPVIAKGLKVLALGELIGDKLPKTGDRIAAPGVIGRSLSGALVGAAIYKADRSDVITGAVVGATVAAATTYISFYTRKKIGERCGINDSFLGVAEDIIAIAAGLWVMKCSQRRA
jgi:uncharacterized membrane protein